jgi:hypothetical protein
MLELTGFDQGEGLRLTASSETPRLLCVVQQGDRKAELGVMWQICTAIHRLGYPLGMLDATEVETGDNPGLQGMLAHGYRAQTDGNPAWPIFPAAHGLRQLTRSWSLQASPQARPATASGTLQRLFADFGALVIYADAETLADVMPLAQSCPVLALSLEMPSLLSTYRSLKQLTRLGAIRTATVVTVDTPGSTPQLARSIVKSLQNCTMKYLHCTLSHFDVSTRSETDKPSDVMRKLVMQMLDHSAADPYALSGHPSGQPRSAAMPMSWSH